MKHSDLQAEERWPHRDNTFSKQLKSAFKHVSIFPLREDNTVDKRHASLFNGTCRNWDKPLLGVSTPEKSISWEHMTMCSNPHWSYSNGFQRQTHVSLVPLPEKKTPGMQWKSQCFQCGTWPLPYICAQLRNTHCIWTRLTTHRSSPNQQQGLALDHGKLELTCSSEITAFNVLWSCINV